MDGDEGGAGGKDGEEVSEARSEGERERIRKIGRIRHVQFSSTCSLFFCEVFEW